MAYDLRFDEVRRIAGEIDGSAYWIVRVTSPHMALRDHATGELHEQGTVFTTIVLSESLTTDTEREAKREALVRAATALIAEARDQIARALLRL